MPRFDDVFTQVHAGDGVNVFEFDSRTAPSKPQSMTWAEAVNIVQDAIKFKLKHMNDFHDDYTIDDQVKLQDAWVTILRGL
jgi:hypothetical protein